MKSTYLRRATMNYQATMLASRHSGYQFQYPHGFMTPNNAYLNTPRKQVE